jgi:flagellar biosynthesis protein
MTGGEGRGGPRRAIALSYDGESAPRVAATGTDALAEEIIALARRHGVPLTENAELAGLLARLETGEEIPELLYVCIAQILAFAYRLRGRVPAGGADPEDPSTPGETVDAAPGLMSLQGPGGG